jgi:hypothetical protein
LKLLAVAGILLLLTGAAFVGWIYEVNPSDFASNISGALSPWLALGLFASGIISLVLTRVHLRQVQARAIAIVFIIFALSVPGLVYYANQNGQVGCLGCSVTGALPFVTTGTILVQPGTGNGTLSVQLRNFNEPGSQIIGVSFINECPNDCPGSNGTISNVGTIVMMYQGNPVGSQNPLPVGPTATGQISVRGMIVGAQYNMDVVATFQGGTKVTQTMDLTAQS